ncbi:MAG: Fic family protein, partial [bacterium]
MAYRNLKKLFYSDPELYKATYERRFHGEDTVHLALEVAGYPAFFVPCNDAAALMAEILRLDKALFQLRSRLPGAAQEEYFTKCLIDEIVVTNRIEGVHSSRREIGDVLLQLEEQSAKKGRESAFFGLVNRYRKLSRRESAPPKTCREVREIYDEIVLTEVAGEDKHNAPDGELFRREMVEVYAPTGKSIHKGLYPETAILSAMQEALRFLHDESVLPLYRVAIFHYLLGYIHPFYDGNGRLGRFLLSACLAEELELLPACRISTTIRENLKKYYDAFEVCNDPRNRGDMTPFLLTMLEIISSTMTETKELLEEWSARLEHYARLLPRLKEGEEKGMSELYFLLVQAALFSERGLPTQELMRLQIITRVTLNKRLAVVAE